MRIDSAVKLQRINVRTGVLEGTSHLNTVYVIKIPADAAIKTMAKVGIKSFAKGSIKTMKFAFKETSEKIFKSGFKNGVKTLASLYLKHLFSILMISLK